MNLLDWLFLFGGLVGLWIGAQLVIRAALSLSQKLGLSQSFIGLTVISLGTSFPEMMLSVTGGYEQLRGMNTSGIIIGNIIGSGMGQLGLILGLAGMFSVYKFKKQDTLHHGLMLVLTTVFFLLVAMDGRISRVEALFFLLFYVGYFLTLQKQSLFSKLKSKLLFKKRWSWWTIAELGLGMLILAESAQVVIDRGLQLSVAMGINQLLIGIFLIGLGTSLPELAVSITALLKRSPELSIGNLIGSYIVVILLALGSGGTIAGWPIDRQVIMFDLPYLLLISIVVVLFLLTREKLERRESFLILSLYGLYVSLKLLGW